MCLKEMFNWTNDTTKVENQEIEIIIADNFCSSNN